MPGHKLWTRERLASSEFQDLVQDQVVTKWASASPRTAGITAPREGMLSTLDDTNRVERYDGATWRAVSRVAGGKFAGTTDVNGLVGVNHGLGGVPKWMSLIPSKQPSAALDSVIKLLLWDDPAPSDTLFFARTYRHDGTNGVASPFQTTTAFYWAAGLD